MRYLCHVMRHFLVTIAPSRLSCWWFIQCSCKLSHKKCTLSFGCHPLDGATRGGPPPPPVTPLNCVYVECLDVLSVHKDMWQWRAAQECRVCGHDGTTRRRLHVCSTRQTDNTAVQQFAVSVLDRRTLERCMYIWLHWFAIILLQL